MGKSSPGIPRGPHDRPALQARGVSVRFGETTVLDDVDLDVRHGEVLALVGPNGAGKSTLLAALAGDLEPTGGEVLLQGTPLARWRLRDAARERAVLTQEHRVSFPFTALEIVRMGRAPWRGRPEEDDDELEVRRALRATDLEGLAGRVFLNLSGGEKARTGFARALAQRTEALLLDEPTAALDLGHQEFVLEHAHRAARAGAAVAVVLHDLTLAAAWADRVVVLDAGRVAGDGAPADVLTPTLLSAVYRYPVEVLPHPTTGELLVVPDRRAAALLREELVR